MCVTNIFVWLKIERQYIEATSIYINEARKP